MAEELSERWGKFSLNEEENNGVALDVGEIAPMVHRGKVCLIGKILADRIVPKDYFRAPLTRIWRPVGTITFQIIGGNMFVAEFEEVDDKIRILKGRPWLFDGNLIALADFDGLTPPVAMQFEYASFWVRMYNLPLACMGKTSVQKIGASVGVVEDVDVDDDDPGWGEYVRVKIKVDLKKPLARGRMLHLPDKSVWVAFKYEKLPRLCYKCGIILHGLQGCSEEGSFSSNSSSAHDSYGPWLRVTFPVRRGQGGDMWQRRSQGEGDEDDQFGRTTAQIPRRSVTVSSQEKGFDGEEGDLHGRKPSTQTAEQFLETERNCRGGVNGGDPYHVELGESAVEMQELRDPGKRKVSVTEIEGDSFNVPNCNGSTKSGTEEKNREVQRLGGDFFHFGKSESSNSNGESTEIGGKWAQKYVGQWDSGLQKMRWNGLKEGEVVNLLKDLVSNTYFPCVGKAAAPNSCQKGVDPQHQKGGKHKSVCQTRKNHQRKSPGSARLQENSQTHSVRKHGGQLTWKQRARGSAGPGNEGLQSGGGGKRKLVDEDEEEEAAQSKKGRKEGDEANSIVGVQAEAGSQPRRLQ
jgi:hypothetical protein